MAAGRVRRYGKLSLAKNRKSWTIEAEPHVMAFIRRVFQKAGHGKIRVTNNDENARDLAWVCQRYPLEVSHEAELSERSVRHDQLVAKAASIIDGTYLEPLSCQMALPPRKYQEQAASLCLTMGGLLVADDLGLGKTVTAITMLTQVDQKTLPAVIVCPPHLQRQWKSEVHKFAPMLSVVIVKKGEPYALGYKPMTKATTPEAWDWWKAGNIPDVIIITYHKMRGWSETLAGIVRSLVFDEVQEMRHANTDKHSANQHVAEQASYRMGLSATPTYNYGGEYFNVLSAVRPGALGTRAEFSKAWCKGDGEKMMLEDPKAFGAYVQDQALLIRRTRSDVARELPPLSRIVHEVGSDPKKLAEAEGDAARLAEIILSDAPPTDRMTASSEFSTRLRQATGIAKAPFVATFVEMLLETGEPVLLFGWHHIVYDIWASKLSKYRPAWYTGKQTDARKALEKNRFLSGDTNLMIISLRSGAGLDGLQKRCATVVHGELDWSPFAMDQCNGRVHRDQQERPVCAYYLVSDGGVDPFMIDALGLKREQGEGVTDPYAEAVQTADVDPERIKNLARAYLERKRAG